MIIQQLLLVEKFCKCVKATIDVGVSKHKFTANLIRKSNIQMTKLDILSVLEGVHFLTKQLISLFTQQSSYFYYTDICLAFIKVVWGGAKTQINWRAKL